MYFFRIYFLLPGYEVVHSIYFFILNILFEVVMTLQYIVMIVIMLTKGN